MVHATRFSYAAEPAPADAGPAAGAMPVTVQRGERECAGHPGRPHKEFYTHQLRCSSSSPHPSSTPYSSLNASSSALQHPSSIRVPRPAQHLAPPIYIQAALHPHLSQYVPWQQCQEQQGHTTQAAIILIFEAASCLQGRCSWVHATQARRGAT